MGTPGVSGERQSAFASDRVATQIAQLPGLADPRVLRGRTATILPSNWPGLRHRNLHGQYKILDKDNELK